MNHYERRRRHFIPTIIFSTIVFVLIILAVFRVTEPNRVGNDDPRTSGVLTNFEYSDYFTIATIRWNTGRGFLERRLNNNNRAMIEREMEREILRVVSRLHNAGYRVEFGRSNSETFVVVIGEKREGRY